MSRAHSQSNSPLFMASSSSSPTRDAQPDPARAARENDKTNPFGLARDVAPVVAKGLRSARPTEAGAKCQEMSGRARTHGQTPRDKPLTPRQCRAVELLGLGLRIAETARRLGIDERTIYRWKKQPAFVEAIRRSAGMPLTSATLSKLEREQRMNGRRMRPE